MEWIVTYKDGAGNGRINRDRIFKTEKGADAFIIRLKNDIRYYEINKSKF